MGAFPGGKSVLGRLLARVALVCAAWLNQAGTAAPTAETQSGREAERRPNFLIFIADDMACDDCGAYGHQTIRTPNLDRLARDSLRFDRAFLTCSSCSPSRSSIMTGRYPHNTGAEQLHWPLPADQVTFGQLLRKAGYWTTAVGKWHLGEPAKAGFDRVLPRVDQMVATLRDRPRDKPFLMWAAFNDPHRPYEANAIPRPHRPEDVVVPPYLPDVPETRKDLAMYYDEITRLDGVVGEVLAELDRQKAADDTFVLFLSDNGRPFPRCKTTVYDSGIRTPFLVRFPGRVKPGSTCNRLVSSIDIAPTLLDLAGLPRANTFQGKSIVPLLKDPAGPPVREYLFAEHNWHDFDDHGRAVRSERFKYIRNYYTEVPGTPPADAVRSLTFQAMRQLRDQKKLTPEQMNSFVKPRPAEELYDTEADPHELRNLATDPKYAEVRDRMRAVLAAWEKETSDGVPAVRTPDEFDRETGERLTNRPPDGGRQPKLGQASRRGDGGHDG
jgi:arylsulfatase A-like enzyme